MSEAASSNIVQLARLRRVAQNNPEQKAKPKVLFVDDEERILNSLKALFRLQYDVMVTTDGYHALELLRGDHYHLLVSDQRMPIIQGVELLQRAREVSPNTMRILLTGFADLAAIVGSVNEGEVYRYINKPWDTDELQEIIGGAVKVGLDLEKFTPSAKATDSEQASPSEYKMHDAIKTSISSTVPAEQPESRSRGLEEVELEGTVLFIEHDGRLATTFRGCKLKNCEMLEARSAEDALQLMRLNEVSVIVAGIDGEDQANIGFLCLLKKEHPHVIAMAVARHGDSETIINLVNSARIFRVIFYPLRASVLQHHLVAAFKQVDSFRAKPVLLKAQQAEEVDPGSGLMSSLGSLIKTQIKSIRSFFGRG